jgi:peptidyl-prolyl cis-trans isomerase-like protein 2
VDKNAEGNYHDPITYKPLSQHTHIVFLKTTVGCVSRRAVRIAPAHRYLIDQGNVYDMSSLHLLAIKTKTFRDLIDESPFKKTDVITIQVSFLRLGPFDLWLKLGVIQDPENLVARDLSSYDYVKSDKRVEGGPIFDCVAKLC